jgi:multiple sugar transport system permease protein
MRSVFQDTDSPAAQNRFQPHLIWKRLTPLLFLAPTFVAVSLGFFYPMLEAVYSSFHRSGLGRGAGTFVGLKLYDQILSGRQFWNALSVSVRLTFGSVVGILIIGLFSALLLNRKFRGRGVIRSLIIIPWAIPYVTAALIWGWMLDYQYGILNYALNQLPLIGGVDWLNNPSRALFSVTIISIWKLFPLGTVMYLAGLQGIPEELYDAAKVDGASTFHLLWHITLPGLRSVTTVLVLLISIWTFGRTFTFIFLLTGGGPVGATENLVLLAYNLAFQFFKTGEASVVGTIVLIISALFAVTYLSVTSEQGLFAKRPRISARSESSQKLPRI